MRGPSLINAEYKEHFGARSRSYTDKREVSAMLNNLTLRGNNVIPPLPSSTESSSSAAVPTEPTVFSDEETRMRRATSFAIARTASHNEYPFAMSSSESLMLISYRVQREIRKPTEGFVKLMFSIHLLDKSHKKVLVTEDFTVQVRILVATTCYSPLLGFIIRCS